MDNAIGSIINVVAVLEIHILNRYALKPNPNKTLDFVDPNNEIILDAI